MLSSVLNINDFVSNELRSRLFVPKTVAEELALKLWVLGTHGTLSAVVDILVIS